MLWEIKRFREDLASKMKNRILRGLNFTKIQSKKGTEIMNRLWGQRTMSERFCYGVLLVFKGFKEDQSISVVVCIRQDGLQGEDRGSESPNIPLGDGVILDRSPISHLGERPIFAESPVSLRVARRSLASRQRQPSPHLPSGCPP